MLNSFNDDMGMDLNECRLGRRLGHGVLREGGLQQEGPGRPGPDLGQCGSGQGTPQADRQPAGDRKSPGRRSQESLREDRRRGGEVGRLRPYRRSPPRPRSSRQMVRDAGHLHLRTPAPSRRPGEGSSRNGMGYPPVFDKFSPWEVAAINAKENGWLQFVDCLGICAFTCPNRELTVQATNAVTGWGLDLTERGPDRAGGL